MRIDLPLPLVGGEHGFEQIAGFQKGVDHVRAQGKFLLADAVEKVFQDVGGLGKIGEAEGARAALDRVGRPKNGVQFLGVRIADVESEE